MRVHILGASGSGTTTLGAALGQRLECRHLDADDFYWFPSDPPFQKKRPVAARIDLLSNAIADSPAWVLSGSLMGWGDALIPLFELVVFLAIPDGLRMERLRSREDHRYGAEAVSPGGVHHAASQAFLTWAAGYELEGFPGRSRKLHEAWLAKLRCPVLRIEGDVGTEARVFRVQEMLNRL